MIADNALDRFGSSRLANQQDIYRAGLHNKQSNSFFAGFSPFENKALMLNGDGHMTIIGGAGAGKGAGLLAYNILGLGWNNSSIINDLKGELAAISIHSLHQRKFYGYCINPFGIHGDEPWFLPQHKVNPFDILKSDSLTLTADIRMIMEMLIKIPIGMKDDYFEVRARQWCGGLLKFLVLTLTIVTLPALYELIGLAERAPEMFKEIANTDMMATNDHEIMRTAQEMVHKREHSEREYSAIMGSIFKNLGWLDDPALQETLNGADFSLDSLTTDKVNIYLIVPAEYVGTLSSFLRLIIGVSMIYKQRKPSAPRVQYLIDEAGQLGYFEMLERAYTFGRGAGIRTCGVFQGLGQMKAYPAGGILGSSAARMFLGTRDYDTARLVSEMMGDETLEYDSPRSQADATKEKMTMIKSMFSSNDPFKAVYDGLHYGQHEIRKEKIKRRLITPEEILSLADDKILLFTSGLNCPPILARKINYFQYKPALGRYMPNPYHPPYDRIKGGWFGSKRIISERIPDRYAHYPQFQKGYWSKLA